MEKVAEILKEIFPSQEMASYLARCPFDKIVPSNRKYFVFDDAPPEKLPLSRDDLAKAIAGAPISLERKRELFLRMAESEEEGLFRKWADTVSQAIQEMQLRPGEFFYLLAHHYNEESCYLEDDDDAVGAFLSWDYIFEAIREYLGGDMDDKDELIWFEVEKWTPDGTGRLKNNYRYAVIGGEVWFCFCEDFPDHEQSVLWGYDAEMHLQVPFHAGDILTVDCRPYAPVSHIVVLEIKDNCDCCGFQALYHETDNIWDTGAVRHNHVFPRHVSLHVKYSPLYRLASFHGELPEKEHLLKQVSQYVNGEEARGAALWEHIYQLDEGGRDVTEDQILAYIAGKGDAMI